MKRKTSTRVLAGIVFWCGVVGCPLVRAQTTGSISGTVKDATGSVIPDLAVIARNADTGVQQNATSNADGFYAFTTLPVGRYEIDTFRPGFKPYKHAALTIDVGTKLQLDIVLELGEQSQEVTVAANAVQVETESSQMGDVVTGSVMTAVGLNGRSFTDLLSLEPGIVPMSTQTPDSIVMSGVTVAITPSGGLNPGNQSISGQREDANGFLVNGADVKEEMNGGTSIIPDLDSLAEFRVLTNNFDAEYGNYAGGIVNVVTKGGSNALHGDAFEFLRNTVLDAKDYFALERDTYQQNQFGGTLGGPIKKNKLFFFGDYQGTRTIQGLSTGLLPVPSLADRAGNFSDAASSFITKKPDGTTGPATVNGSAVATQLQNSLGYTVSQGEPYYTPGCTSSSQCVFPSAIIPQSAWTAPSLYALQHLYIPLPNDGPATFSGADNEHLRDDKTSLRIDANSVRWGNLSAYYFFDDYRVSNPFPSGQGGATVPGFSALNYGRAQLISLGHTKTFGSSTVNEAHLSYMRNANVVGQPEGHTGISAASQGFVIGNGAGSPGLVPLAPFTGVENVVFVGDFVMGTPITNLAQANNTFLANESLSKIIHSHTLKAGVQVSFEQVNVHPDATLNGTYLFDGYQTGNVFADYLIGSPNQFEQAQSEAYYPRHKYAGWFVQDSWRAKPSLTLNYGMRVELMQYWSEKYDQVPTFNPGEQSMVYPKSFPGLVYASDPGIPNTLVPQKFRYAPRIGLAYSPNKAGGLLGKLIGGAGKTSIRASYGFFNSMIQGNSIAIDEPQPPYGLSAAVFNGLFAEPYALSAGGSQTNPFPLVFPPYNQRPGNPANALIQYIGVYNPQSGMTAPPPWDTYPYTENYFFSIERQLPAQTVLSLSYVGSEAHHLPVVYSNNPGIPALCLALNQSGAVGAVNNQPVTRGQPPCGPGGENNTYNLIAPFTFGGTTYPAGTALQGTRMGLNPSLVNNAVSGGFYGNDDYLASMGNSNYNALQVTVKSSTKRLTYSLNYTYSKSIDQASSISDTVDPFNFEATRGLSAWNLTHNFVATYDYQLPLERLARRGGARDVLQGWELSGITRISSGFPVTLSTSGDNSLQGSSPNGVNNRYLDVPDVTGASLEINSHPQNGLFYFNPAAFTDNALGTPGNVSRRYFSGPGMLDTDLALLRNFQIRESQVLQFRLETFNIFNTTQFFGPAAVNGNVDSKLFAHVVNSASPRLMQVALKFTF